MEHHQVIYSTKMFVALALEKWCHETFGSVLESHASGLWPWVSPMAKCSGLACEGVVQSTPGYDPANPAAGIVLQ